MSSVTATFNWSLANLEDLLKEKVKRIVLCSGKVYFDLWETRAEQGLDDVAIIRIEQLYPFPR